MTTKSLKTIALAATAFAAISSPLGTAQAQSGYDYLFWPLFSAWPAPAPIPSPTPLAVPAPRHVQVEAPRETQIRYAHEAEVPRQAYSRGSDFMIGIGF
jgi:hypothetical protein